MEYKRNCLSCKKVIEYSCYRSWYHGNKANAKCRPCSLTGKKLSKEHVLSLKSAAKNRWSSKDERDKQRQRLLGKQFGKRPSWWCERISQSKMGHVVNTETRRKIARAVREFRLGKVTPCYNPNACILIDEYGKQHGFNFQHAENGGEVRVIGYSLDGYDRDKNVVIEIDEPSHKWKLDYDKKRQKEIEEYLGCEFIRIKLKE